MLTSPRHRQEGNEELSGNQTASLKQMMYTIHIGRVLYTLIRAPQHVNNTLIVLTVIHCGFTLYVGEELDKLVSLS